MYVYVFSGTFPSTSGDFHHGRGCKDEDGMIDTQQLRTSKNATHTTAAVVLFYWLS